MRQNWRSKRVKQTKQNKACLSGSLKNYENILKRDEKKVFLGKDFFFTLVVILKFHRFQYRASLLLCP